jgi:hypothetical protein
MPHSERIVGKLRDATATLAAGKTARDVVRKRGVIERTYHRWK